MRRLLQREVVVDRERVVVCDVTELGCRERSVVG